MCLLAKPGQLSPHSPQGRSLSETPEPITSTRRPGLSGQLPTSAWKVSLAQSCPALCGPVDCSPPDSSVHRILQARILEWVAISFSRGSSQSRDPSWVSCTPDGFFSIWATTEAHKCSDLFLIQVLGLLRKRGMEQVCQESLGTSWGTGPGGGMSPGPQASVPSCGTDTEIPVSAPWCPAVFSLQLGRSGHRDRGCSSHQHPVHFAGMTSRAPRS